MVFEGLGKTFHTYYSAKVSEWLLAQVPTERIDFILHYFYIFVNYIFRKVL